jgi:sugar lactone lactonase YvrE
VHRYATDGRLDRVVRLPVSNVTSCTFGGPALADLYITSAREGLSPAELADQPLAGGLFVCRGAGAGLPTSTFGA